MVAANHTLPDLHALHPSELKALIFSQHVEISSQRTQILSQHEQLLSKDEQLASRDNEIEQLQLLIAKLRRMQFGRKSEKVERQIEQLQLRLDELEANRAEQATFPATLRPRRSRSAPRDQHGGRCRNTCRARRRRFCRSPRRVPIA